MKTAYLGTSEFAATVLRALAESPHDPVLVVSPPDRKKGRGQVAGPPPAVIAAQDLDLPVHQTADVNHPDSVSAIEGAGPEALVVCAFGQIVKAPLLDAPGGILNVHPSLLPRWRGAAPIERAIMAGDQVTGTSIMRLEEGLDSGPVALAEEVAIGSDDYFDDVSAHLAEASGRLLVRALDLRAAGEIEWTDQGEDGVTYAEKITAEDRRLDPARDAAQLAWAVRGLNPHIGTHIALEGEERLGVRRAHAVEGAPPQGRIEPDEEEGLLVLGTASAGLALEIVQPPGKKPMSAAQYMNGYPVPERAI